MSVTSVAGHLLENDFEARYAKGWQSCDPKELFFKAKVIKQIPAKFEPLATMLKTLARNSDMLVMWLDCDREGEAIGYEVLEVCQQSNPRIQVRRAHFSALIPRDIHNAMRTLTAPDPHLRDAVEARSEIDLRLGAAFTRYQTLRLQRRFKGCGQRGEFDSVISYGPCQFPTLGFVVERYKKIEGFVPQGFWTIELDIKVDKSEAKFRWVRGRLFDRACCAILFEELVESAEATVVDINNRRTTRARPVPLSTVEMQKALSRAPMRLSSSKSMEIAEALYQKGFISYPRTETDSFKEGTDMQALIQLQTADPQWGGFASMLLTGGFQYPSDGGHDDGAHPPIHPTKPPLNLNPQEQMVYEYIARHFLACCSRDAVGQQSIVTVVIGADERFTARGLAISERNFLDVYRYERWGENALPLFQLHQKYKPSRLWMRESRTEPPPLLSEVDLITLMDKNGIGTDATIAQHIKTIQERNYAECHNHVFTPTPLGLGLVDGYESLHLQMAQPTLRAHMEASLNLVARGLKRKDDVIAETLQEMHRVYESVEAQAGQLDKAMEKYFPRPQGQGANLSAFRPIGTGAAIAPPAPPPHHPPPPSPPPGGGAVAAAGSAAATGSSTVAPPAFQYTAGVGSFRPPVLAPRNSVRPGAEGPAGFVNADRVPSPSDFGGDGNGGWGGGGGAGGGTGRGSRRKNGGASSAAASASSSASAKRGGRGGRAASPSSRRESPSASSRHSSDDGFDGFGGDFQSSYRNEQQQRARYEGGGGTGLNFSSAASAFGAPLGASSGYGGGGDGGHPSYRYNPDAAVSGGGGGGGGSDLSGVTCYRCHQQGHFAPSCPNAAAGSTSYSSARGRGGSGAARGDRGGGRGGRGGGGGNSGECFHCHQTGHWSKDCPNKH